MINPALRRVWRDGSTLQLGTDPGRAVVIGGLDRPCAQLVERVDGTHDLAGLRAVAARLGVPAARADHLLGLLERSGVLHDGAADHRALARLSQAERDRLQPDVAAASATRAAPDGGAGVLGRRRDRVVVVHGAGRLGAAVVRLLAAAGVGTIGVVDPVLVGPADLGPAGLAGDRFGVGELLLADGAADRERDEDEGQPPEDGRPAMCGAPPGGAGCDVRSGLHVVPFGRVGCDEPRLSARKARFHGAGRRLPVRFPSRRRGVSRTPEPPAMQDNRGMPTSVLIVDDHPSFRLSARRMLEADGYTVVGEAEDGAAALEAVRELDPDLVLLDIQLPDLDGFEVAARLGAAGERTAIVLTSTRERSDFGEEIAVSPARGFVTKGELSGEAIAALIG